MTRKKKRISESDQVGGGEESRHRNFTMISRSDPVTVEVTVNQPSDPYKAPEPSTNPATLNTNPPPNIPYDEEAGGEGEGEGEDDKDSYGLFCIGILRAIFIILALMTMIGGAICISGGIIMSTTFRIDDDAALSFVATASIIMGILALATGLTGISSGYSRNRTSGIIFITLLLSCVSFQILASIRIRQNLDTVRDNSNSDWEALADHRKIWVQEAFKCCGFNGPEDRPGSICPSQVEDGCKSKISNFIDKFQEGLFVSLYISIVIDLLLLLMAIAITFFYNPKP